MWCVKCSVVYCDVVWCVSVQLYIYGVYYLIWPVEQKQMTSTLGVEIHLISSLTPQDHKFPIPTKDTRNP